MHAMATPVVGIVTAPSAQEVSLVLVFAVFLARLQLSAAALRLGRLPWTNAHLVKAHLVKAHLVKAALGQIKPDVERKRNIL